MGLLHGSLDQRCTGSIKTHSSVPCGPTSQDTQKLQEEQHASLPHT